MALFPQFVAMTAKKIRVADDLMIQMDPGDSEALTLFFGPAGLVAIAS
jgi:hypothetical protein